MGHGDVINAGRQLFARINTIKSDNGQTEKLDAQEIAQAKRMGFSMFNLTEGMTEEEFVYAYTNPDLYSTAEQSDQMEKQERDVHVKYLQLQYNTSEEIREGETVDQFEARLVANQANAAGSADAKKMAPKFGVDEPEQSGNEQKAVLVVGQEDDKAKEGDYGVKNGKTFKFTKGEWKEIKTDNASKAPEVYNPDDMPEGREGDFAVRNGDTYRFKNGQWVQIKTQ